MQEAVDKESASIVIFSHDLNGKSIVPLLAAKMNAGLVSGAVDLPRSENGFTVKKAVFSGKAYAHVKINTDQKIISLLPNSIEKKAYSKSPTVEDFSPNLGESRLKVLEQKDGIR